MGLFKKIFGDSGGSGRDSGTGYRELNGRYERIRNENISLGFEMARERGINVGKEPFKIARLTEFPGNVNGEHYWHVSDFILSEYSVETGLQVASAFVNLVPQLGFDPYGKVMVGMQFVDKKAGSPTMMRLSFMKEHPHFYEYLTEKDCPERTEESHRFLANALFQFPSIEQARKIFPTLIVVPEVKKGVIEKAYSVDKEIAEYITGR